MARPSSLPPSSRRVVTFDTFPSAGLPSSHQQLSALPSSPLLYLSTTITTAVALHPSLARRRSEDRITSRRIVSVQPFALVSHYNNDAISLITLLVIFPRVGKEEQAQVGSCESVETRPGVDERTQASSSFTSSSSRNFYVTLWRLLVSPMLSNQH